MRVLVTGAGGFVGTFLMDELCSHGHEIIALDLHFQQPPSNAAEVYTADILDTDRLRQIIEASQPDACVHLGAIAFVPAGKTDPEKMLAVNILGTTNILDAFREYRPEARILFVSTAHVYGPCSHNGKVDETTPPAPVSIYGLSKVAAETAVLAAMRNDGMPTLVARPTNHTGPGQASCFVVPAFANQLKAIAKGKQEPILHVGNLDSERDFLDVRDVVRAYRLLLDRGRAGQVYNIGGRQQRRIRNVLNEMCELLQIKPEIIIDNGKFRPTDRSPDLDVGKLAHDTGWAPEFDMSQTLHDMVCGE